MKPSKCLLVRNQLKAEELQPIMGDEWLVTSIARPLIGQKFEVILVVDQPLIIGCRYNLDGWKDYIEKLRCNGTVIEVY